MTRGQISAFIERHNTAWEIAMAALAAVYLGVAFSIDEGRGAPTFIIGGLAVVFLAEFGIRLWDAPSRRRYVRGHWLDLVSCIPLVGGLRALRILRLLRLGAALRIVSLVGHEADNRARRDSWWFLGPLLAVFWLGAAAAYWSLEHGVNPSLHSFGDALYWTFITATTVGYGDITPTTPEGRILAGILIFVGIGLIGFASAQLTQRLLRMDHGEGDAMAGRLAAIEEQIRGLREDLLSGGKQRDAEGVGRPGRDTPQAQPSTALSDRLADSPHGDQTGLIAPGRLTPHAEGKTWSRP